MDEKTIIFIIYKYITFAKQSTYSQDHLNQKLAKMKHNRDVLWCNSIAEHVLSMYKAPGSTLAPKLQITKHGVMECCKKLCLKGLHKG